MQKFLKLLILSFIIFGFSCNKNTGSFKVGILISTTALERWSVEANIITEKLKAAGGEVITKSAENDENLQISQATELIDSGVEILILNSVNGITAASIVRYAHSKNVKVIAYDRIIRNCDLDYFITFDGEKVGELIANYILTIKPSGNFVLLNGDKSDENAIKFYNGTMKALQPAIDANRVKIIYSAFIEDYSAANAAYFTDMILEYSGVRVDAILAPYDGLADGIHSILEKRGLVDSISVTGQDAEIAACYRIMTGHQAMTVYKPGKNLAGSCANLVLQIIKKESIKDLKSYNNGKIDVPSIILDPIAVDKNNMANTVVADGMYTMEKIMSYKEAETLKN
jgi:D-xylose transport system substrate-binding protein